jgi:hypothetical protein
MGNSLGSPTFGFAFVLLAGCGDERGARFPCSEQGIRAAIAAGDGPGMVSCLTHHGSAVGA